MKSEKNRVIYFTKHAIEKFKILRSHGLTVSREIVKRTVKDPEKVDHSRSPLKIVQRGFDRTRVLRVVYKEEAGRKMQYESR